MKRVNLFLFLLLFLPACGPSSKNQISQRLDVAGLSFADPSEEEIRDDVRQEYARQENPKQKKEFLKKRKKLSRKQRAVAVVQQAKSQEAKLADIPVPLQAQPLEDFFDLEQELNCPTVTLGYATDLSSEDLVQFYQREMDRHGWRCLSDFSGKETLTSYVKPARVCSVSIRPRTKGGADLVIFTGPTTA